MSIRHQEDSAVGSADAYLKRAQFESLLRQVPFLYVIGTINSIMLASTFVGVAPRWLTMICPVVMSAATLVRTLAWVRQRRNPLTDPGKIARQLRVTNVLATTLSLVFIAWALTLMRWGDALQQMHVAFFAVVTGIGCAFCLVTLPFAAISMISIIMLSCAGSLLLTGRTIFISEVLDILLVYGALVLVFLTCHRHLASLAVSRQEVMGRSEEIAALHELAQANERRRLEERRASTGEIVNAFSGSVESVSRALAAIAESNRAQSRDLAADSEAALRRVEGVEQAATTARANLDLVLDGTVALLEAIGSIRHQIARTAEVSERVENKTETAIAAMESLRTRVGDIDDLTRLITQVTQQINLIALNATIEAARAGEAGRSFAVVATEIKTLAATTAQATDTITRQVGGIKQASSEAMTGVQELNRSFLELDAAARGVAEAATIQTTLTDAIRGFVDVAMKSADAVDDGMSGMRRAATANHDSAVSMLGRCEALGAETETLTGSVQRFLAFVRTSAA